MFMFMFRVEACFIQSHMSEHLKHMICSNYAQLQLGDALVALRSSAVGEDVHVCFVNQNDEHFEHKKTSVYC